MQRIQPNVPSTHQLRDGPPLTCGMFGTGDTAAISGGWGDASCEGVL